ncbi:hypothetical protein EDB92DRAFT_1820638 [Lactarius akahatsu]|uniref:SWIM-type domain-containing protein n=1 Tax=Lactarius akahatsu TaxID=416441 RepID=A0AAD4L7P1_9AGAM|nr:hypothetical protein EDB92DRAFT_1820638 [Lactarius akahatsu]
MLPQYEIHTLRQTKQFEGVDLAKKWCKEIFTRTPEMSANSIQCLGSDRFYVRSLSDLSMTYLIDLSKDTSSDLSENYLIEHGKDKCNCPDWPRAWLCKHIAAVAYFSSDGTIQITHAAPEPQHEVHESPQDTQQDTQGDASPPSNASTAILENLITVSREYLSDGPPSSPGTIWSLWLVESHLMAIGIGMLNCKQPHMKNTNPYSGGLRSGKNAAPDAWTPAQNKDTCAHITTMTNGAEAPPSQPTKWRCKCASTPPPPPSSMPQAVPGPSAQWYPNAAYSQVLYYTTYPMYWHYGHFPPSQPYYPSTQ